MCEYCNGENYEEDSSTHFCKPIIEEDYDEESVYIIRDLEDENLPYQLVICATNTKWIDINYCPMCGRKLK